MTIGELKQLLKDTELTDDTTIIITDAYTGAFVKDFEVDYSTRHFEININTEDYL